MDIVDRLRHDAAYPTERRLASTMRQAADEIERLRKEVDEERSSSKTFEALLGDATDELERITKERNGWQAKTAGISQDISNAEDELDDARLVIERLRNAGDHLAASIRTGRWDGALDAWDDVRGGDAS